MLENTILDYFSNAISAAEIAEKFNLDEEKTFDILWQAQREWDAVDVDPEGPTPEQDQELDIVLARAAEALKEIKKESN